MQDIQSLGDNKNEIIIRQNSNTPRIINNIHNSNIPKIKTFSDIYNENDFVSQIVNKKYARKIISKSVTTTFKHEYKLSHSKYEINKMQNNSNTIKNDKCSTILRSQSSILNQRPIDNIFVKNKNTMSNYEINNYNNKKTKINNQYKKLNNEEKIVASSSQKGFENFTLSKVCGSSHPKNNNNNDIHINCINNEYTFIKNYTLKYNYEENIDLINNENNIHKCEINDNNNYILNENKMIDNKENICKNKEQKEQNNAMILLPEYSNKKIKNKNEINKSFSNKNIKTNCQSQKVLKRNEETKNNYIFNKYNKNKNKNKFLCSTNNLKNKKSNNKTYNMQKNNIKIYCPKHKDKIYYFRNNDKKLENSKNDYTFKYKNKKLRNQFLTTIQNLNEQYSQNYSKHNTFSEKTINIIKKFGSKDNMKCVMPANNLMNILFKNENELLFNTNNH